MFTGIITAVGEVVGVADHQGTLRRLRLHAPFAADDIAIGASLACSGPCLTVVAKGAREDGGAGCWLDLDCAAETLRLTTAGAWRPGTRLNLERAMKIGDELGGHIVTGHIDGIATIEAVEEVTAAGEGAWGASARFTVVLPHPLARFVAAKGSVCLDGTSLTVNTVDGDRFTVLLIPHTMAVTTWGERRAGDRLNLEVDLMARYAARLAEAGRAG
jgi:riboflavin synthase